MKRKIDIIVLILSLPFVLTSCKTPSQLGTPLPSETAYNSTAENSTQKPSATVSPSHTPDAASDPSDVPSIFPTAEPQTTFSPQEDDATAFPASTYLPTLGILSSPGQSWASASFRGFDGIFYNLQLSPDETQRIHRILSSIEAEQNTLTFDCGWPPFNAMFELYIHYDDNFSIDEVIHSDESGKYYFRVVDGSAQDRIEYIGVRCEEIYTILSTVMENRLISLNVATDEFLSRYDSYTEFSDGVFNTKSVFSSSSVLRNCKFIDIGINTEPPGSIYYYKYNELFSFDELTPEKPFVVIGALDIGTLSKRGIAFVDENNILRCFCYSDGGGERTQTLSEINLRTT